MKKLLSLTIALAITVSLASCGKKAPSGNTGAGSGNVNVSVPDGSTADSKTASELISFKDEDGNLVFTLSSSIPLAVDSWIGICEKGSYVYEDDADEGGIAFTFFEERESDSEPYVFKLAYDGLDDGEYTMVLCDTDNAGYVMASWAITLNGGKPSVDLSGFKLNPKPANMPAPADPAETVDPEEAEDFEEGRYDDGEPDDGAADA